MINPADYQEVERWLRNKIILARDNREVVYATREAIDWLKGEWIAFKADKDVALEDLKAIGLGTFQGLARTDVELRHITVIPTVLNGDAIAVDPFGLIEINSSVLGRTGRKTGASEIKGPGAMAVAGIGELAFKQRTQEGQKILAGELTARTSETLGTRAGQEPAKILGSALVAAAYSQPGKGIGSKFAPEEPNRSPNNTLLTAYDVLGKAGSFSDAATLKFTAAESRDAMKALIGRNNDQAPGRPHPQSVPTPEPLTVPRAAPGGRRILGLSQDLKIGL